MASLGIIGAFGMLRTDLIMADNCSVKSACFVGSNVSLVGWLNTRRQALPSISPGMSYHMRVASLGLD